MPSSWCAREIGQAQSLSELPSLSGAASEVQVGSSGSLLESSPTDPEAAMTLFCYPTQLFRQGDHSPAHRPSSAARLRRLRHGPRAAEVRYCIRVYGSAPCCKNAYIAAGRRRLNTDVTEFDTAYDK
jgi:hypothetical protein